MTDQQHKTAAHLALVDQPEPRDPVADPRIGDRLRLGRQDREIVAWRRTWREHIKSQQWLDRKDRRGAPLPEGFEAVVYQTPSGHRGFLNLAAWRAWASRAEAVNLAQARDEHEPDKYERALGVRRVLKREERRGDAGEDVIRDTWVMGWGTLTIEQTRIGHNVRSEVIATLSTGPVLRVRVKNRRLRLLDAVMFALGAFSTSLTHAHEIDAIAAAYARAGAPVLLVVPWLAVDE